MSCAKPSQSAGRFLFLILLLLFTTQNKAQQNRFYVLKDEQYFKPMLADIRAPEAHMRIYRDPAVLFSNSTKIGLHTFWDVTYGGYFPFAGFSFSSATNNSMQKTGLNFFLSGSAQMLLDFDTASSDVINTDFRIGGGIATRLPILNNRLALRIRLFHESSHVGDEFVLGASQQQSFRRYNVSYEALEFFVALDDFKPDVKERMSFCYWRIYSGIRQLLGNDFYEDFASRGRESALKVNSGPELQSGLELFWKGWEKQRYFLAPQYFVIAGDGFLRDQYDLTSPQNNLSLNIIAGIFYGNYFNAGRTVKWYLNYYRGVNPHGQFRATEIEYLGINYAVTF
ncbi:MAG: DUF1207 domain-containing protein [Calditrichota bacterium]